MNKKLIAHSDEEACHSFTFILQQKRRISIHRKEKNKNKV